MKRTLAVAVALALAGASTTALAVTDSETNASIPFSLSNPGARSLGMAGAFVGLADDATAAFANPAGLTQLVQTEISLEGRHTEFSTPYINGGSATASPFNTSGVGRGISDSDKNNLSYLSVVFPHDRWAFAFYRHELARFNTDFTTKAGGTIVDFGSQGSLEIFPFSSHADLKILNYGATAAYKVSDNVSVGLGLSRYDFTFKTATGRVDDRNPAHIIPASGQAQVGDDNGYGWNLGARFRLSDTLSAGVTYRRAPKFDYKAVNVVFEDNNGNALSTPVVVAAPKKVNFDVPDLFGVGLSWRPTDALVVNFDVDRVEYSQLTDDIDSLFLADASARRLRIPDGTEVHLGAEYTFANMAHPLSLRGGLWRDPRHSMDFSGTPNSSSLTDVVLATLFSKGRGPETHYSLGLGWAFKKFQFDFAGDFSKAVDTYSVSGVYRF